MTEAELEQWVLLAKWGADRIWRFRAFMGRGNGRSKGEWPPHRDRRCQDCRNRVTLYGGSLVTHNSKDYLGVPNLIVHSRP
jgi:hypothetical protein